MQSIIPKSVVGWLAASLTLLSFQGCGGGNSNSSSTPPPSLATASLVCAGGQSQSGFTKSQLTNYHVSGPGTSCGLTAGSVKMDFTAAPTVSWITISPTFGTLPPGQSTAIGVITVNASSLPNAVNKGGITVTAPGYQDNTVINVEIDCSGTDSHGNTICTLSLGSTVH